eukprot:gene12388-12522_t
MQSVSSNANNVGHVPQHYSVTNKHAVSFSGISAISSSVQHRTKQKYPLNHQEGHAISFVRKVKLAWNIFFPAVTPKEEGKKRLRMILVADRCGMTPAGLGEMKRNILRAMEGFVKIDSNEQIDVNVATNAGTTVYSLAVPIKRIRPAACLFLDQNGQTADSRGELIPNDFDADPSARFPYGT